MRHSLVAHVHGWSFAQQRVVSAVIHRRCSLCGEQLRAVSLHTVAEDDLVVLDSTEFVSTLGGKQQKESISCCARELAWTPANVHLCEMNERECSRAVSNGALDKRNSRETRTMACNNGQWYTGNNDVTRGQLKRAS